MKKIFPVVVLLFCGTAHAARTSFGTAMAQSGGTPGYLVGVADAWASIFGNLGPGGAIAARMTDAHNSDLATFYDLVSIIGHNDTAITLFETDRHIAASLDVYGMPLGRRRTGCQWTNSKCNPTRQVFTIDGTVFGGTNDFDSRKNGDFRTNTTGVSIRANTFLTEGFALSIGYTRSMTDTHHGRIYTDAVSNGLVLAAQYYAANGMYLNVAATGGKTRWANDKTVAGIVDSGDYDTEYMAGQVSGGIHLTRGHWVMTPHIGARYSYIRTDKHIDAAAQAFEKWFFNTITAMAGVMVEYEFTGVDYRLRPNIRLGGGYDALRHGNSDVRVRVLSGQFYDVPVEVPARAAFQGGLGLRLYAPMFSVGLEYQLDMRRDYTSHSGHVNLKISF